MIRSAPTLVLAAAAMLALAACGGAEDDAQITPAGTPTTEATTAEPDETDSPSPEADPADAVPTDDTPLEASDGEDLDACYDGTCEVEVPAGTALEFHPDFGIGQVVVTEIGSDAVSLSVLDGSGFSQLGVGGGGSAGHGDRGIGYTLMSVDGGAAIIAFYPVEYED